MLAVHIGVQATDTVPALGGELPAVSWGSVRLTFVFFRLRPFVSLSAAGRGLGLA